MRAKRAWKSKSRPLLSQKCTEMSQIEPQKIPQTCWFNSRQLLILSDQMDRNMTIWRITRSPTLTQSFRRHLKILLQSRTGEVVKATLKEKKDVLQHPASFLLRLRDKSSALAAPPWNPKGNLSKQAVWFSLMIGEKWRIRTLSELKISGLEELPVDLEVEITRLLLIREIPKLVDLVLILQNLVEAEELNPQL